MHLTLLDALDRLVLLATDDACQTLPGIQSFFDQRLPQPVVAINYSDTDLCDTNISSEYLTNPSASSRPSTDALPSCVMMDLDTNADLYIASYCEQPFQMSASSSKTSTAGQRPLSSSPIHVGQSVTDDCGEDTWSLTGSPPPLTSPSSTDSDVGELRAFIDVSSSDSGENHNYICIYIYIYIYVHHDKLIYELASRLHILAEHNDNVTLWSTGMILEWRATANPYCLLFAYNDYVGLPIAMYRRAPLE